MKLKRCGQCSKEKDLSEFGKHKRDGFQSICKICAREYAKEYSKRPERVQKNRDKCKKWREGKGKEYFLRPDVKEKRAKYQRNYRRRPENKERMCARYLLNNAINRGTIKRGKCSSCNSNKMIEAHHENYAKPLEVIWLCCICHKLLHKKKGK